MSASIATFTVILRSSWGSESEIGTVSIDQSEKAATIKHTLASMLYSIANELYATAYDGPTAPMPWLDNVDLVEFTNAFERDRSIRTPLHRCGALPAKAFRGRYPDGCVGDTGHDGNHCTDQSVFERAQRRAARLAECDLTSPSRSNRSKVPP